MKGTRAAKLYRDAAEVEKRKEERGNNGTRNSPCALAVGGHAADGLHGVAPSNLADASFQGRKEAAAKASLKFQKQCTFKPAINTYKPPRVQKTDAERKREREARIAEERQRRDLEELNECSFQPRTNHDVPREARPMARTGRSTRRQTRRRAGFGKAPRAQAPREQIGRGAPDARPQRVPRCQSRRVARRPAPDAVRAVRAVDV